MNQTESASPEAAIENAEAIIERFGGIRPMATKINVPVTTVQGWKKRNVIPGNRRTEIIQAAQQLGVDLGELMGGRLVAGQVSASVANENDKTSFSRIVERSQPVPPEDESDEPAPMNLTANMAAAPNATANAALLRKQLAQSERRAITVSTFINVFLIVLALGSAVMLLWPENEKRMGAIETNVRGLQEKQTFFSTIIPDDLEARLANLQGEVDKIKTSANSAMNSAGAIAGDVLSSDLSLQQRVQNLEGHVADATGIPPSPQLSTLLSRLQSLGSSLAGEQQLNRASVELTSLLASIQPQDSAQVNQAIDAARAQNPDIAETFKDIPPQDLKAAAMLLGMSQFRAAVGRDNQPFQDDLILLEKLVGTEDPALLESIQRLAPYAEQGVLTPEGLSKEFRGLAGDVVVSSLKGEDISVQEKARARLNEVFQVEKNGEPVSGTPTQNTLARADKMLQGGDLEGAIVQVQSLSGPAAITAQPWVMKAQATLMAQKFKSMLTSTVHSRIGGASALPIVRGGLHVPGTLVQDKDSGVNMLVPNNPMQANPYR